MKKTTILMMALLLGAAALWARPGYKKPVDVRQADGTTVTLLMQGDEFLSFETTLDGYTVLRGSDGYYRYAVREDGRLKTTSYIARNAADRNAVETAFLQHTQKMQHPDMTTSQQKMKQTAQSLYRDYDAVRRTQRRMQPLWDPIDYDNFKGLVVLVEWNDREFLLDDPQSFYQRMINEKNLQDKSHTFYPVDVTGSVRDYFYDNSLGQFEPTFDVVGPYTINYSCTYPKPKNADGTDDESGFFTRQINIIKAIMSQVNSDVDLSQYDLNSDGTIDMVYFIFAGYGSYVQGNDYHLMWPHANDFSDYASYYGLRYDNKKFGRYACSMEIQDSEELADYHTFYDGIGTMCHEFSHVLGLADHYDTDYNSNGLAITAGEWDVMDGGADMNYGLTPAGYSAFERHLLGFATPQPLDVAGSYQLEEFGTSNQCYLVNSATTNKDFYLENRQKNGFRWDAFLPGSGLLAWYVDTTKPNVWRRNEVNIKPDDMHLKLLGNSAISTIDFTADSNELWGTTGAATDLFNIRESDGVITFEAGKGLYPTLTEDFEDTPLTSSDATDLTGKMTTWSVTNATVESVAEVGYGSGERVVKIGKNGILTSGVLEKGLRTLTFTVQATGTGMRRVALQNSTDGGTTWKIVGNIATISTAAKRTFNYTDIPAGSRIRLAMTSSVSTVAIYVDDITYSLPRETAISAVDRDATTQGAVYNLAGQRVSESYKGLVVRDGKKYVNVSR